MNELILASTSVYRKQQLERLNIKFTTAASNVDEELFKDQVKDHVELSEKLALLKARAISEKHSDAVVIGGDQVLSFGDTILNKPLQKARAVEQLQLLSGNDHQLITSTAIVTNSQEFIHTEIAHMSMRELSTKQIMRYIELDDPLHCCGSYRLEAAGISLFEKINCDDYTSIIGIPLMWTAKKLNTLGFDIP